MSTGSKRQRSAGSWELKLDIERGPDGQRRTRTETFKGTGKQADRRLRDLMAAVDRGEHVDRSELTVAELVRARIVIWEEKGEITVRTSEHYRELSENYIVPHLGQRLVQRLTTTDLEGWYAALRVRGRKDGKGGIHSRTIRQAHNVLSQALGDGVRHRLVSRNVATIEKAPRVTSREIETLRAEEVEETLAKLHGHAMYTPAVVALYTGLRRSELLAIRWPGVDLDNKLIQVREALEETRSRGVRFKVPKTACGRRDISLPDIIVDALREYRSRQLELRMGLGLGRLPDNALVFPADLQEPMVPLTPNTLSARWRRAVRALGLPKVTWHALRHSHASMLLDGGLDIITVSKRLGHASPVVTLKVYAHQFKQDDRKAAAMINKALASR